MSELSDIDPSNVGLIGYYNAIAGGNVNEIDPAEVTSASNVIDYTLYDNGVEGTCSLGSNDREANFRVKSDGWCLVWTLPSIQFTQNASELPDGPWDMIQNLGLDDGQNDLSQTTLALALDALITELSNSSEIGFSPGDAKLFDYANPNATTISSHHVIARAGYNDYSDTKQLVFSFDSGTEYDVMAGVATCEEQSESVASWKGEYSTTGTDISIVDSSSGYGTFDILTDGGAVAGTEYELNATDNYADYERPSKVTLFGMWR